MACRVVAVHEAPPVEGVEASVFDTEYDVQWMADGRSTGELQRMPRTELFRKKPVVAKLMLKTWIAEVATCETVQGVKGVACVWRANDDYVDRFNLPLELPTDLQQKLQKAEQRKAQQASKAAGKTAAGKAAEQQAIKDQAAAIAAAAFAQGSEAESDHQPEALKSHPVSIKEQAAAIAAAAFGQAPPQSHRQYVEPDHYDDDEEDEEVDDGAKQEEEDSDETGRRPAKRKRMPVPRPTAGTPAKAESLEEVEQRLQPGSVKHAIFQVLRNYGHKGRSVSKIVEEMSKKGLREFSNARNAKSSVASTCAHDAAFARVAPGTFALRSVPGVVEVPPSTPGTKSTPADREEEEEPEEPIIKPAPRFAKFERNNFKCTRCLKMHHPEGSPLALCDSCPRSFHLLCMGVEWEELPEGDWACPRCAERKGIPTKRLTVDDVKNRQAAGNGRISKVEQEKTDKMLIKSLEREERERKRAEERAEKEAQRQLEKDAKNREREEAKKMARYPVEDVEVAQEELAALLEAQQDVRRAMQSVQSSRRLDEEQQEQQQQHLADAEARAKKLRTLVQGPQTPAALFPDAAATASYVDALAVVEFVNTFGRLWETLPISLSDLQQALQRPQDHPQLGELYHVLLSCVLLDQVNEEGPGKSRARRWARVFHKSTCTWPEILRRYLLATRAKTGIPQAQLTTPDPHLSLLPDHVAAVKGALQLAAKPWYRLSPPLHLRMLTVLCNDILDGASMRAELAGRVDQISALHSERHQMQLEERRQEKAAERERKQEERQRRLEQLEKQLQGLEQAAADEAPADDQNIDQAGDQAGDQAKPAGDGAVTPGDRSAPDDEEDDQEVSDEEDDNDNKSDKSDDDNEQGAKAKGQSRDGSTPQPEGADPQPKSDGQQEEEHQPQKKRHSRQDWEARIAELPLRSEPVGLDRHHRKYWLLSGDPTAVHVQSAEGDAMSIIDTPSALDAALAGCNRKGNREKALTNALKRDHTQLRDQLRAGMPRGVSVGGSPRGATPSDLGDHANGEEVDKADKVTVKEAVEQLQELLAECSAFQGRLPRSISFKGLQQRLEQVHTAVQLCQEVLGIEGAVSLLGSGPRGSDSIAKATEQASLAALPEASQPPQGDPHTKCEATLDPADSTDRSAASASISPKQSASQHAQQQQSPQQQQQQTVAAQWVETDDLGISKRQVVSVTKHALPNGIMPQSHSSMQQPQDGSQQPQSRMEQLQGGVQQPQGSTQQPPAGLQQSQGSMLQGGSHAPQGSTQEPQGRMQQPEGGMHGGAHMAKVKSEGLPLSAKQAAQSGQPDSLVKHELSDADQMQGGLPQPQRGLQSPSPSPSPMEGVEAEAPPQLVSQAHLVFAQPLDELDPSDTEQEKASRPKLALWRSARERGIWMQDMAAAQLSTSAAEVAYLAAVLSDKAQPMLQRLSASAAAAAARPPKAAKAAKRERDTPTPDQPQVAKKLKIKLPGSVLAAQQGSTAGKGASKEGLDRWMAECADCGEEGDLLCCEAKDCPIAMHMECAGLEKVPRGKWYCPQHANQPKASKPRPSSAKSSGELDSSVAPSTSGKAPTAGPGAPSKTGANSKSGAGGKGKGRAQGQEDAAQGEGGKKSGGKAGKKRQAEAEPADLPPKPTGKAGSKAQGTDGSKAGKAQPEDALTAAPARKKSGSGDGASKASAENGGKQKSGRGKEDSKKQPRDAPIQKGDAGATVRKKDPEEKFEASNISDKHGGVKVKFKRLKKADS
ncbi:hypothetical protein ABBQ32_012881 [Trebouxia sp. C0010 RCD-2024]